VLTSELTTADLDLVRSLERRRIEATGANDADALEPLLHDELIYVNSVGAIYDKPAYLRDIRTQALIYDRDFDVRETEVRILDDVIILVGVMLGHSRLDGEQQVFHFPSIAVWRKDGDTWRLLAWQSSSGSPGFMLPPALGTAGHFSDIEAGALGGAKRRQLSPRRTQ
jgi:ketosteroid isomerase-like protein